MKQCANGCGRPAESPKPGPGKPPKYCGEACRKEDRKHKRVTYSARDYAKHKTNIRERHARNYRKTKEQTITRVSRNNRINAEAVAKYKADYRRSPTGKANGTRYLHERRARERTALVEQIDRRVVWKRDKGLCGICGSAADSANWDLDHIIPLGPGDHIYANVRVTHPSCNKAKSSEDRRILTQWKQSLD